MRELANPYSAPKRGWNQVSPEDVLLPQQSSSGATRGEGVGEEEGPDILVPFPLLSGIALSGTGRDGRGRGRMSLGELREAMRELHSKASKSAHLPLTLPCFSCLVSFFTSSLHNCVCTHVSDNYMAVSLFPFSLSSSPLCVCFLFVCPFFLLHPGPVSLLLLPLFMDLFISPICSSLPMFPLFRPSPPPPPKGLKYQRRWCVFYVNRLASRSPHHGSYWTTFTGRHTW